MLSQPGPVTPERPEHADVDPAAHESIFAYDPELLGPQTDASMLSQLPDVDAGHLVALAEALAEDDLDAATRVVREGWYDPFWAIAMRFAACWRGCRRPRFVSGRSSRCFWAWSTTPTRTCG